MAFRLIFRGKLAEGVSQAQAAEALEDYFKKSAEEIEARLFSGSPIQIKLVQSEADATKYVEFFATAGMHLEIMPESASAPRKSRGKRRWPLVTAALAGLTAIIVAGAAWYTSPVWRGGDTSVVQANISHALATDDLLALVHIDVARTYELRARFSGGTGAESLFQGEETFWSSLAASGMDPASQLDDILAGAYSTGENPGWAVVLLGRIDADAAGRWIESRYDVSHIDPGNGTIYFSWLDEETCEAVPLRAARMDAAKLVITSDDRIDALWSRVASSATAQVDIDEWLTLTGKQLLTLGVFTPTLLGQTADGLPGMILGRIGEAAVPVDKFYFGAAPTMTPPGVTLSATITSDDAGFLDQSYDAGSMWFDSARTEAATNSPEAADLFSRAFLGREDRALRAGIRLDRDFDDELKKLITATLQSAFSVSPSPSEDGSPTADRVDESPAQFAAVSASQIRPFDAFGSSSFMPQWQEGPFALSVSKLGRDDQDRFRITLSGEGRGLPNLNERSKLTQIRVTGVTGSDGKSLVPQRECGLDRSAEWTEASQVYEGSQYVDNEFSSFSITSLKKEFSLIEGATPTDVAAIRGEIEHQIPVRVSNVRLDSPIAGKSVDGTDVRIRFTADSASQISYQVSGDARRVLAVRGLNAAGQVLQEGGAMWGGGFFGGAVDVAVDVQGTLASVEVILAEEFQPLRYSFAMPGAVPPIDTDESNDLAPPVIATPDALERAMQLAPPEVLFEYNKPVATSAVGPALLALQNSDVIDYAGLVVQLEVYVPRDMPIAGQLNGMSLMLDRADVAAATPLVLDLGSPVSLSADGPDRLIGRVTLQSSDYRGESPQSLYGRILFRTAVSSTAAELSALPGSTYSANGVTLRVGDWQQNALSIDIEEGVGRILSITVLDSNGVPAGRASNSANRARDSAVRIELVAIPESLLILLADETVEHERAFTVNVPAGQ